MINKIQINTSIVLSRMREMALTNEEAAETFALILEETLDTLMRDDFFGTEGQSDPRGDFRNGDWDMNNIETSPHPQVPLL